MKKRILSAALASACVLSALPAASAASIDLYGGSKMNIWDFYLTENNAERPDSISSATLDAVSQATYNQYDNLPVDITAAVNFDLLADCMILEAHGIENTSITKILQTWREGYKTTLLGNSKTDVTYPLEKSVLQVRLNDGAVLYVPYRAVADAASTAPDFSWTAFLKAAAEEAATVAPYRVKYLLESGEFGKGVIVSSAAVKKAPALTVDQAYTSDEANVGKRVKIDFSKNADWAEKVYAVTVNGSGLIAGEVGDHASTTVINGETSFLSGALKADKTQFLIRLSQKFKLGDNTITVMAHGYEDAACTISVSELSQWMVDVTVKNQDTGLALTDASSVQQGDTLLVQSAMTGLNTPGEFDSIWVDGRLIKKVNGKHDDTQYKHLSGGKLEFYTNDLGAGAHELRLKRAGYPDSAVSFTVVDAIKLAAPVLTAEKEPLSDGTQSYSGDVLGGLSIALRADTSVKNWLDKIQRVYWTDGAGKQTEITSNVGLAADELGIVLTDTTFQTFNKAGSYTISFKARGFEDISLPIRVVKAMPAGITAAYQPDGSVLLTSGYSFLSSSELQSISIDGKSYPVSAFELKESYSSSTLTIPSEFFEANSAAVIQVKTKSYSDLIRTVQIPETHQKRSEAPAAALEAARVTKNDKIVLNFTDDSAWRAAITSAVFQPESSSSSSPLTISDRETTGKLTLLPPSYTTGKGTLVIKAAGYRDFKAPLEVIEAVPGTVSYEMQNNGNVLVSISSSTYLNKVSVSLDGTPTDRIEKTSGKLTILSSAFAEKKAYNVTLTAAGYADYSFSVNTDVQPAPALIAPEKPLEQQAFAVSAADSEWAEHITGAVLSGSYSSNISFDAKDIAVADGILSFAANSKVSSGTYTLKILAEGYLPATVQIVFVKPVPGTISYEVTTRDVLLSLSNSSYRSAVDTIRIGDTVLARTTDFTVDGSNLKISADRFPSSAVAVVLTAPGYADSAPFTIDLAAIQDAPEVTLPSEIVKGSEIVLTSEDSSWAAKVSKVEIGKSSYPTVIEQKDLTVQGGSITVPNKNFSAGTGNTIKIYAEGYRTKVLQDVTIYAKPSSAFLKTTAWDDGALKIDLADTTSSYSNYSVESVFVNDSQISGFTKPTFSNNNLTIPAKNFEGLHGQEVTIRITSSSYNNLPELSVVVTVPVALP